MYICQSQPPNSSHPTDISSLSVPRFILYVCFSISVLKIRSSIPFFWRRQWQPTPVLLPGKFHGRRILVGCSPWGSLRVRKLSDFTFTFHFHALEKEMATHSSVLAWRIPETGEPGRLPSTGPIESDTTEAT